MIVGFTGTQAGMTEDQKQIVLALLLQRVSDSAEFWHGNESHADTEAATIAKELGYKVIAWPGDTPDKQGDFESDVTMPVMPNLVRNKVIAHESDVLIATPATEYEVQRSGTWATIRYARTAGNTVIIVRPSGVVSEEKP